MISNDSLERLLGSSTAANLIGDIARPTILVLIGLLTALAFGYYWLIAWPVLKYLHFNDFGKFYYATQLFERGQNMYGDTPATAIPVLHKGFFQFLDMNPPHLHALLLPLTALSVERAFAIWAAMGVACLVASLVVIAREVGLTWTMSGFMWTLFVGATCAATAATVVTGQLTFLLLLPVTLAWRAARRNRWRRAALYLGVLMSLKPFFGVFAVYALLTRRWTAIGYMATGAVGMLALGLLTFGIRPYIDWLHALSAVSWLWASMNGSVFGLISRMLDGGPMFTPLWAAAAFVRPVAGVISFGLVCVTLAATQRNHSPQATDWAFLAFLLLAELVSPLGWIYYLWLDVGPAAAVWIASRKRPSPLRDTLLILAAPGFFVPLAGTVLWNTAPWSGVTIGSAYAWTMLLLWSATIVDARVRGTTDAKLLLKAAAP